MERQPELSEAERLLAGLVRAALSASDLVGRVDVAIHLNAALVALDGIGDPGLAAALLEDATTSSHAVAGAPP